MMDLQNYLHRQREYVNSCLEEVIPAENDPPVNLHRAMRHSIFAGGKRLRPILVLEACRLNGTDSGQALQAALAMECFHTFTLIHDDLPCMDDDDYRRGVQTCHRVFGEATALLAGDSLIFLGYELLAQSADSRLPDLLKAVSASLGSRGVTGGQVLDLEAEGVQPERGSLEQIHELKTARFLMLCLETGALIGGASPDRIEALKEYGRHLGMAFQITDDLLDEEGNRKQTGKSSGGDRQSGKMTYPALVGLEQSRALAAEHAGQAKACLEIFPRRQRGFLERLPDYLLDRKS